MTDLCLVTGGAGFIGSHLVEGLTAQGRRVRVFDDFSTGLRENLAPIRPAPEIVAGDLRDPGAVRTAVRDAAVVFHLGAVASVQRGIEAPDEVHAINATGTVQVLHAAQREGVRRVIYAGSASAYGVPAGDVQREDDPLSPLSTYAASKLAGEMYCQAFTGTHGLETVRLRFFNIFGPRQRADSPYSGVIALFIAAMTNGRRPTIFGDGLQSRDFTFVGDVVQALIQAAQAPGISSQVYNIGTGRSVNLLELTQSLNRLLGTSLEPTLRSARAGDIRHSRADITAARRQLGYEPRVAFEDGLRQTLSP